ncbi:DUF2868 domain-containing protein [Aquabacterium humicola]|uniref:DUF2868 domain-containing protein n=1 Tax=Aquabacterium humicola TaxID=3237377 RepID=UPI002543D17F|nr:DUF2868 domain-containing protein [Rubrivivax pictus]
MTEEQARAVVLVQAFESGEPSSLWTPDDRAWATRVAREDAGRAADDFAGFVVARATHALQRLLPRDAAARHWIDRRRWSLGTWLPAAAFVALLLGLLADRIGAQQQIDLFAPPVVAVVAWNLAIYLALPFSHSAGRAQGGFRRLLLRWRAPVPGPAAAGATWAVQAAPLSLARLAALLHAAAAALALGLIAGLYVRGLGRDYRAGWQSTFLDAPAVQGWLETLLAPAAALTGITVPDVAPLRVLPGQAAMGDAAPWIHLFAATLLLVVVLPRLLLAAWSAWRAASLARRFPLALDGAYFDRLRLQHRGARRPVAEVLPHGAAPSAGAVLGLRTLLAAELGAEVELRFAAAVPYGDEEGVAAPAAGATLRIALFDLSATPEAETHGRLLDRLAGPLPRLAVIDETTFRRRFASMPERLRERRALWQSLAAAHGVRAVCVELEGDVRAAAAEMRSALA